MVTKARTLPRYNETTASRLHAQWVRASRAEEKAKRRLEDYRASHTASFDERLTAMLRGKRIPSHRLPTATTRRKRR